MVVRKMKEKCKDAARMRREKERSEFVELSKLLPLPQSTTSQLDKASIIRLTSSYLRMRSAFPEGLGENWGKDRATRRQQIQQELQNKQQFDAPIQQHQQIRELGSLILQTLDGFVFALHKDGKIMYISETASVHLGLPQIDLTGSSVFEYVHPSDHNDIYEILSLNEADKLKLDQSTSVMAGNSDGGKSNGEQIITCELGRSFCMRMKCILPKRNAGLVSSGYKAIHCNGYLKVKCKIPADRTNINNIDQTVTNEWESYALVAVGHSLLPTASTEIKLSGNSFMFRANLDFKLYYVEAPVIKLLGFEQVEMIGQSLYNFVHLNDMHSLEQSHKSLLEKSQIITKYYRLMKKDGGFVWIQSYASLVCNPRNMPKPQHIVSICFVLGVYNSDESCAPDKIYKSNGLNDSTVAASAINCQFHEHQAKCQHRIKHGSIGNRIAPKKYQKIQKCSSLSRSTNSGIYKNGYEGDNKTMNLCQQHSYHTYNNSDNTSFVPSNAVNVNSMNQYPSLASIRRPSDDTCSIVSSIASTSMSSSSSQQSSSSSSSSSSSTSSEYMNYQNINTSEYEQTKLFNSTYNPTITSRNMDHHHHHQILETPLPTSSSSSLTTTNLLLLDSSCSTNSANTNYEVDNSSLNITRPIGYPVELLEIDKSDPMNHQSNWLNSCETNVCEDTFKNQSLSEQFSIEQFNYQHQQPQSYLQSDSSSQAWFSNATGCSSLMIDYQNPIDSPNNSDSNTQGSRQQFSSIYQQHENTHTLKSDFSSCHSAQKSSEALIYFQ